MALSQQGWLRRRIISPIIEQLKQGNNPDQIALSLAVGITLACFPVIGVTTLFCLMAGVIFKLNHPTLQLANHSSALLQLALIIPFCRLGERLLGATGAAQSPVILALFKSDFAAAARTYCLAGLRGAAAWCLVAPFFGYLLYKMLRPVMQRLSRLKPRAANSRLQAADE